MPPVYSETNALVSSTTLKRLPQQRRRIFRSVRLYLDDLEEIKAIFCNALDSPDDILIFTDEYLIPDVKLLGELGHDVARELVFAAGKPRARLIFTHGWASLTIDRDDHPQSIYVFDQIEALLERRRPPRFWR